MYETMDGIEKTLRAGLAAPLPAGSAQRLMAPVPRPGWDPERESPGGRPAAVLVLIYPLELGVGGAPPAILLTQRTSAVAWHKRQVSFPGGVAMAGEAVEETALREAREEVGLDPAHPRILGRLSPLWVPATGFTIHPVAAMASVRPLLTPNPREVDRLIEVPLRRLLDPECVRIDDDASGGRWTRRPYFAVGDAKLWGASAMIMAELLVLLGWAGPPRLSGAAEAG